jgi:hypothetical protein
MRTLLVALWVVLACNSTLAGTLVSRAETAYIFSLNLHEWETYATRVKHPPSWNVSLSPNQTGTVVMAFDPATGVGLSVQPLYRGDDSSPESLIFGSYYPPGTLPAFTSGLQHDTEEQAREDLGSQYSVVASYGRHPFGEGVELTIQKSTP